MARFKLEGIDGLMKDLSQMDIERIAPKMLEAAVPILEQAVKRRAAMHKESGDMYQSIKPTKPKRTDMGYSVVVRPTGKDANGVRNMEKAAYLEYGTATQAASPVISPAIRETEEAVAQKMQDVFDRETGAI